MDRHIPSKDEVLAYLKEDRNWGRWGDDDQLGAMNLVTPEKRVAAARLVQTGRAVSLSRVYPKTPAANNPNPAQHFMKRNAREPGGGSAVDYYGVSYHGQANTHLDALCHVWDENGMWNGRRPGDVITYDGATWGSIEHWKEGISTRGVLLDVPRHRGEPFVTMDRPIHGWELEDIAQAQGITLAPGDAVAVYGGREKWGEVNGIWGGDPAGRPGLHASCLKFLRESDCCLLVWDMMDFMPQRLRYSLERPRRHLCLRYRPPGQRPAGTPGRGLRRGGSLRVHADCEPAAGGGRHRLAGEPHRAFLRDCVLSKVSVFSLSENQVPCSKTVMRLPRC